MVGNTSTVSFLAKKSRTSRKCKLARFGYAIISRSSKILVVFQILHINVTHLLCDYVVMFSAVTGNYTFMTFFVFENKKNRRGSSREDTVLGTPAQCRFQSKNHEQVQKCKLALFSCTIISRFKKNLVVFSNYFTQM